MNEENDFETTFIAKIRAVYNSGDCAKALDLAKELFQKFPESHRAKYQFAVMHGDYSYSPIHSETEKLRLLEIAKQGVKDLFLSIETENWPIDFRSRVKNEYYWFHELHSEQYELGIENIKSGQIAGGNYSACVGSSMLAFKFALGADFLNAEIWAKRSLEHFKAFEKLNPGWYNINYFSAQADACLGNYESALSSFKDMYRKQKSDVKIDELQKFQDKVDKIKAQRLACESR